ncbi:DNA-binding protein [Piscirickettsia salmonis]|uniref:DNA-binding protein n=1 Tax=Piscirickettsia salmonis TaxID=1238 RepID=UPI0007C9403C|nr:hypothetical protein A0O36_00383 [Piscirickettsiaceae bacterium NZ-RLO1]
MKYITTQRAASIFGVNDSRIRQKCINKELNGIVLNRELFIIVDDDLVSESDIEPGTFTTIEETAVKMNRENSTIRRWCIASKIPAKKIGRNWFVLKKL